MSRILLGAVCIGMVVGCAARAKPIVESPPQAPSGDHLFEVGDYANAIAAYTEQLALASSESDKARLRTFIALARFAQGTRSAQAEAFEELRAVEHEYGHTLWGRVARLLSDEITYRAALRRSLMAAGAELTELQRRIAEQEEALRVGEDVAFELKANVASLREERRKAKRQLEEAQKTLLLQEARIVELTTELQALKEIDMQRRP